MTKYVFFYKVLFFLKLRVSMEYHRLFFFQFIINKLILFPRPNSNQSRLILIMSNRHYYYFVRFKRLTQFERSSKFIQDFVWQVGSQSRTSFLTRTILKDFLTILFQVYEERTPKFSGISLELVGKILKITTKKKAFLLVKI